MYTAAAVGTVAFTITTIAAGVNATIVALYLSPITLTISKFKLETPEKFKGKSEHLANFLFNVKQLCEVLGISDHVKITKMDALLLNNKLLNWWHSISQQVYVKLGVFTWDILQEKVNDALIDWNHLMHKKQKVIKKHANNEN